MQHHEHNVTASHAVTLWWNVAGRSVSDDSRRSDCVVLRAWVSRCSTVNHITARAQEQLLQRASQVDARVSLLESVFVNVAIHVEGRRSGEIPRSEVRVQATFGQVVRTAKCRCKLVLVGSIQLEIFLIRVPMLRSPRHLRGRLRECQVWRCERRFRARLIGDVESREWKLFGLIPMMLLHKPKGTGSVGRSEWAHRFDLFVV